MSFHRRAAFVDGVRPLLLADIRIRTKEEPKKQQPQANTTSASSWFGRKYDRVVLIHHVNNETHFKGGVDVLGLEGESG